jgi:capsular polysaccharide biosynthesis protein
VDEPRLGPVTRQARTSPRPGVWQSMLQHPVLAALPVVVLVAVALAYGVTRSPQFTASARLAVSGPAATLDTAPTVAALYARSATAQSVIEAAAAKVGLTAREASKQLSATPIGQTPVFTITATGPSADAAIALANAASNGFVAYATQQQTATSQVGDILTRYQAASEAVTGAEAHVRAAQQAYASTPTTEHQKSLEGAQAELNAASLRADTLRAAYQSARQHQLAVAGVTILNPATEAAGDRRHKAIIITFAALVAGLLAGAALATARATRSPRRRR